MKYEDWIEYEKNRKAGEKVISKKNYSHLTDKDNIKHLVAIITS